MTASYGAALVIQGPQWTDYNETYTPSWTNAADGTIRGTGATVTLSGAFSNAGLITTDGGTLNLGQSGYDWQSTGNIVTDDTDIVLNGNFATGALAGLTRTGGSITLNGTVDNTGAVIDVTQGVMAGLQFNGGEIDQGTLIDGPGAAFDVNANGANLLSDVTVQGGLSLDSGGTLTVSGGAVQGSVNESGGYLVLTGGVTVSGTIAATGNGLVEQSAATDLTNDVTLADATLELTSSPSGTVTIDAGVTVAGYGAISDETFAAIEYGQWYNSTPQTVDNQGTIAADVAGQDPGDRVPPISPMTA